MMRRTAITMFSFPPNRRAKEAELSEQIEKIAEELEEVRRAKTQREQAEELMDCLCAVEGALRKFATPIQVRAYNAVYDKGMIRGDFYYD